MGCFVPQLDFQMVSDIIYVLYLCIWIRNGLPLHAEITLQLILKGVLHLSSEFTAKKLVHIFGLSNYKIL